MNKTKVKNIALGLIIIVLIAAIVLAVLDIVFSKVDKKQNPIVTMEVEGYGTIKIELYPDVAPNTVKNFIKLAQNGFYNGKTFNDIEDGLVRGGAVKEESVSESTGEKTTKVTGPKLSNIKTLAEGEEDIYYSIEGEFMENGFDDNNLSHQRGVISMYRKSTSLYQQEIAMIQMMGYSDALEPIVNNLNNSQTSQFFILTEDNTGFNGLFAAFGRVTEGMDVVDAISKIELKQLTSDSGEDYESTEPVNPPVISNVSVDTFGVDYGEPETIEAYDFDEFFDSIMSMFMQSSSYSY